MLVGGSNDYGLAVAHSLTEGDLRLDLGVKFARDGGSLMGFSGAGDQGGATMAALTVSLSHDVGTGGFFALSGEMGIADLAAPTAIQPGQHGELQQPASGRRWPRCVRQGRPAERGRGDADGGQRRLRPT